MKKIIKGMILSFAVVTMALALFSCATSGQYDDYDSEGYTVSVKYDANGGMFTTNVEVIVDSFKLSDLPTNESGKKELRLLELDDERRGKSNAYSVNNTGYFLAGWYKERNPVCNADGEPLDADGNVAAESGNPIAYTYAGRWDFDNDVIELDPDATYTSNEPITLYAAWLPRFKYEFYRLDNGEKLGEYEIDPNYVKEIQLPTWSEKTGELDMKKFPTVKGMTLEQVYTDAAGTQPVEGTAVAHAGQYDATNATAADPVMKLYLDFTDGEWFKIYTADQFLEHAKYNGNYEIVADLDFEGKIWPSTFMHGNFAGRIDGGGHTFKNISIAPKDTNKMNNGLFGTLTEQASVKDIRFENVTMTIATPTRLPDINYGLFAGQIKTGAVTENISFVDSSILIDAGVQLPTSGIAIGLFCGVGSTGEVDLSGITCELIGDNPNGKTIEIDGNYVTVKTPA